MYLQWFWATLELPRAWKGGRREAKAKEVCITCVMRFSHPLPPASQHTAKSRSLTLGSLRSQLAEQPSQCPGACRPGARTEENLQATLSVLFNDADVAFNWLLWHDCYFQNFKPCIYTSYPYGRIWSSGEIEIECMKSNVVLWPTEMRNWFTVIKLKINCETPFTITT